MPFGSSRCFAFPFPVDSRYFHSSPFRFVSSECFANPFLIRSGPCRSPQVSSISARVESLRFDSLSLLFLAVPLRFRSCLLRATPFLFIRQRRTYNCHRWIRRFRQVLPSRKYPCQSFATVQDHDESRNPGIHEPPSRDRQSTFQW